MLYCLAIFPLSPRAPESPVTRERDLRTHACAFGLVRCVTKAQARASTRGLPRARALSRGLRSARESVNPREREHAHRERNRRNRRGSGDRRGAVTRTRRARDRASHDIGSSQHSHRSFSRRRHGLARVAATSTSRRRVFRTPAGAFPHARQRRRVDRSFSPRNRARDRAGLSAFDAAAGSDRSPSLDRPKHTHRADADGPRPRERRARLGGGEDQGEALQAVSAPPRRRRRGGRLAVAALRRRRRARERRRREHQSRIRASRVVLHRRRPARPRIRRRHAAGIAHAAQRAEGVVAARGVWGGLLRCVQGGQHEPFGRLQERGGAVLDASAGGSGRSERGGRPAVRRAVVVVPVGRRRAVPEPRRHAARAAEMYGAGGRGGAAGGSGVGGGVGGGGGSHANNRAGSPESAADVFRQGNQPGNAPPQFIFDGYGGAPTGTGAGGGGAGNGAHPSMSLDSSYDTYAGAQFKQSARAGGGPRGHARDARARLDDARPAGREPARRPGGRAGRGTSSVAARSGGRSRRSRRT